MGIWVPATSRRTSIDGAGRVPQAARFTVLPRAVLRLLPSPRATPLAMVIVLSLLASAAVLHTHPGDVNAVVAWTSTNVHNLARHPVAAILLSTFVVPGSLFPSLVLVAVALAALERAMGVWRTVIIAFSGQLIATLITEYGADLGAQLHLWTESSAERPDVGVSYVMYTVLAAGVLLLPGRAKTHGLIALSSVVLSTSLTSPDMTSAGHVLSVAVGAATMRLFQWRGCARVDVARPRPGGWLPVLLRPYPSPQKPAAGGPK